jgi:hypothetical protein
MMLLSSLPAEENKHDDTNELFYKNTLFHYYSGDYITALSKAMINNEKYNNSTLEPRNKLLLGGIYLAYGLNYDAKTIFENINTDSLDEELRNIIWFYIGRDFYRNFDYNNSAAALERISEQFPRTRKLEKTNILSNVYVHNNNLVKLERMLENSNPDSANYQYILFNLAIAHLKQNNPEKGKKYLIKLTEDKPENIEQASIADKARLHLANLHFKNEDYKSTIKYIDDMNADGLFAESAIYLSALAHSMSGNSKRAFSLLNKLKTRESKDIYQFYSILLIARILEQNGNLEDSLKVLNDGVVSIQHTKKELDELIKKIRSQLFFDNFRKDENGEITIVSPQYKYLLAELSFNRDFSGLYNHYIDLLNLRETVNHWKNQIPEFYIMLKERDKHFKQKKKAISTTKYSDIRNDYAEKLGKLEIKFNKINATHDVEGLYTQSETEYSEDLNYVSDTITKLKKHEDLGDYEYKVDLMKGINYWNAAQQYHTRIWETESNLKQSRKHLKALDEQIASLKVSANSEFNYSMHKNTIDSLYSRLKKLDARLETTTVNLKEQLIKTAAAELDKRFKNIDSYYRAFKFDVARVSDRIVLNKK